MEEWPSYHYSPYMDTKQSFFAAYEDVIHSSVDHLGIF